MTKLKIVGNSHVAAFKAALDGMAEQLVGTEVSYFAWSEGPGWSSPLRLGGGKCLAFGTPSRPASSKIEQFLLRVNGATKTNLADQDVVVLVGHYGARGALPYLLADHDIDGLREVGAPRRMSAAAFDRFIDALAEATLPPSEWWHWDGTTVYVLPAPLVAETCRETQEARFAVWRKLDRAPEGFSEALQIFNARITARCVEKGLIYVPQPEATITSDGLLTRAEFKTGAVMVGSGRAYAETDHFHMNAEYAVLCLAPVLDGLLSGRSQRRSDVTM